MIILFILALAKAATTGSKCKKVLNNDAVYIFDDLQTKEYSYQLNSTSVLHLRFCQYVTTCSTSNSFAVIVNNPNEATQECFSLTKTDQYFADQFDFIDPNNPDEGVYSYFKNAETNFGISYILYCNSDEDKMSFIDVTYDETTQQYLVSMESASGCPLLMLSQIIEFMNENSYIVSILLIGTGLIECFIGKRILKPTLFIFGYLFGFFFTLFITSELDFGDSWIYLWVSLLIAVLLGAIVGGIAMNLDKAGVIAAGIGLGVVLALLFWNAFLGQFLTSQYILYSLMIIFSIVFSLISFKLFDHLIIFSTSFLGSYLVFKAIGLIVGGFPSEVQLISGQHNFSYTYYIYFVCIIVLAIGGVLYQYKEWGQRMLTLDELKGHLIEIKEQLMTPKVEEQPDQELKELLQEKISISSKNQVIGFEESNHEKTNNN